MNIFTSIQTAAAETTTSNRGSVKRFILATLSYAKHHKIKLTNKQVATLTTQFVPGSKTTTNSVADYINKLNTGLFDYYNLDDAKAILDQYQPQTAPEPVPEPVRLALVQVNKYPTADINIVTI